MKRMSAALWADVRFQFRQGFYLIYLILTTVYLTAVYQVGDNFAKILVPILIFFDPAMVGFIFTGGLILLEKQQGVTGYIGITPLKTNEYMTAKIISMSFLALLASVVIAVVSGIKFNIPGFLGSVIGTSAFFTLLGLNAVAACRTMNDYFIRMIPYILIVAVPCLGFINEKWAIPFRLFPTFAGLRMLLNSFGNPVGGKLFSDFLILLAWCLVLYLPVKKKFEKTAIGG